MSKLIAPPMVYVKGEEMTRYGMELILEHWIRPNLDTSAWEIYDLSCKCRDMTNDQVLNDIVAAGARIKAIFKEPTITPTAEQQKEFGLTQPLGSPNGAMRKGWNGITISRDTIHIPNMEHGYKKGVIFERQAIGGEYGAQFAETGPGTVRVIFEQANGDVKELYNRKLTDARNMDVFYHNPLDNTPQMARHFFNRCLEHSVTPYVVTKKTVFKWQEPFWQIFKDVFNTEFKDKFVAKGLLELTRGDLAHLISDAATMKLVAWTNGGFGMAAHNYDGDMLTDLMGEVHGSPGLISSVLVGVASDGSPIMEFEASHGTVSDMYKRHQSGQQTSLNPTGMVHALVGALNHSGKLAGGGKEAEVRAFTDKLWAAHCKVMTDGRGTRDIVGPTGSTTEDFVAHVGKEISGTYKIMAA
jgi:isocitrate dehydrogenase